MEPISGASVGPCGGSMGNYSTACANPAKWKQTPTFGDSVAYYCDEHKKLQEGWDKILYDSKPRPTKDFPEEYFEDVRKLFEKMDRRKRKKDEPAEEPDPAA